MPPICDLHGLGPPAGCGLAVATTAVARDDPDGWSFGEPSLDGRNLTIGQKFDNPAALEIADDRSVSMPALPCPVVDTHDLPRRMPIRRSRAHHAQQRVLANRKKETPSEVLSGATTQRKTEMVNDALQSRGAAREWPRDATTRGQDAVADRDRAKALISEAPISTRWMARPGGSNDSCRYAHRRLSPRADPSMADQCYM